MDFQLEILKGINSQNIGKNLMVSPLSIYHILSLTANGAANTTLNEMLHVLGNKDLIGINKENALISSIISKANTVKMANAIFTTFKPETDFIKSTEKYKSTIDNLISVDQVNSWCFNATNGKIDKIIDDISGILMILINAIYFKGIWKKTFDKKLTKKNIFLNFNKEQKKVDFMNMTANFNYFENKDIQAIEIPYNKDKLNALIILPKTQNDINAYINNFTGDVYNSIIKGLQNNKIVLSLPKFEIRYEGEIKSVLMTMGMNQAFANADFSVMKKEKDIFISRVIHKTFIKVDEQGTEAAAVTAVVMKRMMAKSAPPIVMNVNHPFLFIIRCPNLPEKHDILFFSKFESL